MPLISFIIPTHNRFQYAVKTITSLLSLPGDIEIIVSDTSDNNHLSEHYWKERKDSRLKIISASSDFTVVDNFNYGLEYATGDYLVFIGDDDFVSGNVIDVANWAFENNVDSIRFSFPIQYFWPDFMHRNKGDFFSGTLTVKPFSGAVTFHDAEKALNDAMSDFGRGVLNMPRAYSGMISARLANQIVQKYDSLFGGVSPDIYSSALISIESSSSYEIDFPIVIPGASGASTSGQSATGKHTGGLRDNPHIGAFKKLKWDKHIPEFYSVPTVWSYSFLKALQKSKIDIEKVNFIVLYLRCYLYYPQYRALTLSSFKEWFSHNGLWSLLMGANGAALKEIKFVQSVIFKRIKARNPNKSELVFSGLKDVNEAKEKCEQYISESKVTINFPRT